MVPFGNGIGPTQEEITNKWFGQEIFAEVVENVDLEKLVKKAHYAELQRRSKSTVNAKSADSVKQP